MSSWLIILPGAAILLLAFIILGRLPRRSWEMLAAAIVLGLAGYAFQGKPGEAAAPASAIQSESAAGDQLLQIRAKMAPNFDVSRQWTITADSFARSGKYRLAASYINSGIRKHPENTHLWAALGVYMMLGSDGQITPPAAFAFARARKLQSRNPAPDYFEGVNALIAGKPVEAAQKWEAALKKAPQKSEWAPIVGQQLSGLMEMMRQAAAGAKKEDAR